MANVYFYKIRVHEEKYDSSGKQDLVKKYKSQEEFVKMFKDILEKRDANNCISINDAPEWVVLEVLNYDKSVNFQVESPVKCELKDSDYVFARIGRKKDITNVQIRDRITHKPEQIKKGEQQDLEIYTYFYLFFDTSIIVYLGAQAAPGISKIADMVNRYYKCSNLSAQIIPVTADDMIEILKNKDIVNSIEIISTLPSDEVINIDNLGLNEDTFDDMRDIKNMKITVSIAAKHRNENLFKNKNLIRSVTDKILGKKPSKLRFKAKNSGEHTQTYDIIEKLFTRSVHFKYTANEGLNRQKEIETTLFRLYNENRNDILKYSRE